MESLSQMLEDYRNGERGLPSYEELVVFASQPLQFVPVEAVLLDDMVDGAYYRGYGNGLFTTENCITTLYKQSC